MNEGLELFAALAASAKHRVLYEENERRAFVSERNENYDCGVRSVVGKTTRLNQTKEKLGVLLTKHGIPQDTGWKSI